jgi:predicted metal-dependent HD superfamily phosphohydrolase
MMVHVTAGNLDERWRPLAPAGADGEQWAALGRWLLGRYADPGRRYHDVRHLAAVLDAIDLLDAEAGDPQAVRLAAWFHDAVYSPRAADNEEQSALLAESELSRFDAEPAIVSEVGRLVRLTATHAVGAGDGNGAVLCDADLAILASPAHAYTAYTAAVREEYAHVPLPMFRAGRAEILRRLLALPRLFATERGFARWEDAARRNVTAELGLLES